MANQQARKSRLAQRPNITQEEIEYRCKSGDSIKPNLEADLNLDTSEYDSDNVFVQIIAIIARLSSNRTIFELPNIQYSDKTFSKESENITIKSDSVDDLVRQGIRYIHKYGERFQARAGNGVQCYNLNYTLENSLDRVHRLRIPKSTRYFARELLAYFRGSLNVEEGLAQASPFWRTLADKNGQICSNYGHYVFHQKMENNQTQFQWVVDCLIKSKDSRKAIININQPIHKTDTKDFPCTIAMQFYIRNNKLCCEISSRSTDVYTGLPYDIGFFSLVNELIFSYLKKHQYLDLELGHTTMKTNFTQIYDKTAKEALDLMYNYSDKEAVEQNIKMPLIDNPDLLLEDIYNSTNNSKIMECILFHAELKKEIL